MTDKSVIVSDNPDSLDYAKLTAAQRLANKSGHTVVVHAVCFSCASETTVRPIAPRMAGGVRVEHDDWCPVLARHEGRELTASQQRKHRRYMDGL